MVTSLRFVVSALVACALILPGSAGAAEPEPSSPRKDVSVGLKGFELMLRPSFGGAPSDSPVRYEPSPTVRFAADPGTLPTGATPWGPGFVGQASVGYRFLPFLSAGLRGGIRTTSASSLNDGSTDPSRSGWDAGFYVRGYPLAGVESVSKYIDPWIGTGVMYMRDAQSYKRSFQAGTTSILADVALDHHAVAVPLAIGVDYRVTHFLSLGPSFEYTIASPIAGCLKVSAPGIAGNSFCSNEPPGSAVIKANTYGVWTVGLDAKVTF